MDENLVRFLSESPMAAKIKLPSTVVVQRTALSPLDVIRFKEAGAYGPIPKKEEICELHIGGQRIAVGKIVKRKGDYYFKVSRIAADEKNEEAGK